VKFVAYAALTSLLMGSAVHSAAVGTELSVAAAQIHESSVGQLIEVTDSQVVDAKGNITYFPLSADRSGPNYTLLEAANGLCDMSKPWCVVGENTIFCIAK